MKKFLSLFLVLLLTTSIIGCSSDKKSANQKEKGGNTTEVSGENINETKDEDGIPSVTTKSIEKDGPSWTWNKDEPITLTIFVPFEWYTATWDVEKTLFNKYVTEQTGISLEIVNGNEERLNAMIASGDLPDIIVVEAASGQRGLLENGGYVLDLESLIEQYAPDYNVLPSMKEWYRNEQTGKWYGHLSFYYGLEDMWHERNTLGAHNYIHARTDLMEKLSIKSDDFSTKEGFINALLKVKESGIEYDGFTVEALYGANGNANTLIKNFTEYFGGIEESEEGEYQDKILTDAGLEAAKFVNKMYQLDLISKEAVTSSEKQVEEKISNGEVFAYNHLNGPGPNTLKQNDPNATYETVPFPKSDSGRKAHLMANNATGWTSIMITKNAKRPDRIIQLFSFLSQDENTLNEYWGVEGQGFVIDEDDHVVDSQEKIDARKTDPDKADITYAENFPWFINWAVIQRFERLPSDEKERELHLKERAMEMSMKDFVYDGRCLENIDPAMGTDEAGILARMKEYIDTQLTKMVIADSEEAVEKLFNETKQGVIDLGGEKIYEIRNANLQKYKKRLGVDRVVE